jgi:hypothetical protein
MARMTLVAFRVPKDLEDRLEEAVAKAKKRGATKTSVSTYARVLLQVALNVDKNIIVANEVLLACGLAQSRISKELGNIISENMSDLIELALVGEKGEGDDDDSDDDSDED